MTDYYVNPKATQSSDLNPGTYVKRPLRTIARGVALAQSGDRVIVYPNTYYESITMPRDNVSVMAADLGVIVNGSALISGTWTSVGSGTYWVSYNPPVNQEPFILTVDGLPYILAALSSGAISPGTDPLTQMVANAWYFDRAANRLYLNIGGSSPSGHIVRAGYVPFGFTTISRVGIVFDGLNFQEQNQYGIRVRGGHDNQILNCNFSKMTAGGARLEAPVPQIFHPTDAGAGGTLTAGTKYYMVTALAGSDETLPSFEDTITIAANRKVQIQCSIIAIATHYRLYGRTSAGETLLTTIAAPAAGVFPTFIDDGTWTPDGTTHPPTSTLLSSKQNLIENCEVSQTASHGINLFAASQNYVRRNRSHHNNFHGIAVINYSNDNIIENNVCYRNSFYNSRISNGIQCDAFGVGTPGSLRNIIQRNKCFKNQDSGISIYFGSHDCIVRGNLCYDNDDHGIDNLHSQNCHMVGNTCYNNTTAGLNSEGSSQGIRMYNNISVDNGISAPFGRTSGNYRCDEVANTDAMMDYNVSYLSYALDPGEGEILWGVYAYTTLAGFKVAFPTQMVHGFTADPQFVDTPNRDFHLQPTSPAIYAGTASAPDFSNDDFDGMPLGNPPNCGVYV